MENHIALGETIRDVLIEQIDQPQSLSEMERTIKGLLYQLGNVVLHLWLRWLEPRYPTASMSCPHCGGTSQYQRKRQGCLHTLFGKIRYQRAYYLCPSCHHGHCPLDERLGLRPNAMSAEVERLAGLLGVQDAFGKGSLVFEEFTLVKLSDHSLDKATPAFGQEVEKREAEWQTEAQNSDQMLRRQREAQAPLRFYGSLDGGRVQTRAAKGEIQPWRELKTLAWFKARGQPPQSPDGKWSIRAEQISYATDICPAEDFGTLLWASGVQQNAHLAHELIFLADGAAWIWNLVQTYFPNAIQIVDWFHACEYLAPVATAAFADKTQRAGWLKTVKQHLWDGQLDQVIAACSQHIRSSADDDPAQAAVTYYTNNRHRMDYPIYRAKGYQIGSGTIESGVKQIASKRLKISGARWNLDSARHVAKARAAFLSGEWNAVAARRIPLGKAA
jgi:hypothetical protein